MTTLAQTAPPMPANEAERLAILKSYRILDTETDPRCDSLTALAADLFEAPVALISLVDENRQWFKSRHGLDATETPRNVAFCAHAIMSDDALVVPDASKDPRFCNNPLVTGAPFIRFYAGYPLITPNGHRLGTLCIIDSQPRHLTEAQVMTLGRLGRLAADEIELHKQQNDARHHANARAKAEEMQTLLLHSINHEFRTPLNAIMGFSELLSSDMPGAPNAEQQAYLKAIHRGGSDILRLVSGIMEMADIESRDIAAAPTLVDAHQAVRKAVEKHRLLAAERGIEIGAQVCGSTRQLLADPDRLAQVLDNMIRNAILYNKPQGAVEVGCDCEADDGIMLYVADTGHGIASARQGEVFQMFNRLGRESSTIPGSGLGLALSKRIVNAMGGRIGFESIEGEGSRFWARFQAA